MLAPLFALGRGLLCDTLARVNETVQQPIEKGFRSRRRLLALLGTGGLLALVVAIIAAGRLTKGTADTTDQSSGSRRAGASSIPIIDVHVHLSPNGVSRLERIMTAQGISHVVNLS